MSKGLRFYEVCPHPVYGNPLIVQPVSGKVFLTVVGDMVVCEMETVYDANLEPHQQLRVTRRSLDNPNCLEWPDPIFLGEIYSNSQRLAGEPEKMYFVRLKSAPNDLQYSLHSVSEIMCWRDGIGLAIIAKAVACGLLSPLC